MSVYIMFLYGVLIAISSGTIDHLFLMAEKAKGINPSSNQGLKQHCAILTL